MSVHVANLSKMEVRWSQVWRIWWVIQQFEAVVLNGSCGNSRNVGWCIVVMK